MSLARVLNLTVVYVFLRHQDLIFFSLSLFPFLVQKYLTFKNSPCPIMIERAQPPWVLPGEVKRALYQADAIFGAFEGVQGLVSYFCNMLLRYLVLLRYSLKSKIPDVR